MSFREKQAWVSLVALVVIYGGYFAVAGNDILHGGRGDASLGRLVLSTIALVVLEVVLIVVATAVTALRSPEDLKAVRDEREGLIALKAAQVGFYVLMSGGVLVLGCAFLGLGVGAMANALFLALVLAEIARYGAQVALFRRAA